MTNAQKQPCKYCKKVQIFNFGMSVSGVVPEDEFFFVKKRHILHFIYCLTQTK